MSRIEFKDLLTICVSSVSICGENIWRESELRPVFQEWLLLRGVTVAV